jgi:acyl-CoA hydrolase
MVNPRIFKDVESCVDQIIETLGTRWVVGAPLGLGKPNQLLNALYRRACQRPDISLHLITALSLEKPRARDELEARLLDPLLTRLFGDYADLEYVAALKKGTLPANIIISEFYCKAGSMKNSAHAHQHYIAANYTQVAQTLIDHGVNLVVQLVAAQNIEGVESLSLSCNTDVTLDLMPLLQQVRQQGRMVLTIAQVHDDLPFMRHRAQVPSDYFDWQVRNAAYNTRLFATPNQAVTLTDYAMGLHAASLIKDGGTLQVGIGALGDAICYACVLRQQQPQIFAHLLTQSMTPSECMVRIGGLEPFVEGLFGCSEMFVNGFMSLIKAGVMKRQVFTPGETQGFFMQAAFFLGPADFYQQLRDFALQPYIRMDSVNVINALGEDITVKQQQRRHARFINSAMMVTLDGAVVSDALEDGTLISGVGGQYNFVSMAQQLPEARSIIAVRATRQEGRKCVSNIVAHYSHCTLPRHLRDIVITEYGVADLRGKTQAQVAMALLAIADSRFQAELLTQAKARQQLPADYQIPELYCHNTPQKIHHWLQPHVAQLPRFPFGSDFTEEEIALMDSLQEIKKLLDQPGSLIAHLLRSLFADHDDEQAQRFLARLQLEHPQTPKEKLLQHLLLLELHEQGYLRTV